jgi:hypothetical protein
MTRTRRQHRPQAGRAAGLITTVVPSDIGAPLRSHGFGLVWLRVHLTALDLFLCPIQVRLRGVQRRGSGVALTLCRSFAEAQTMQRGFR